MQSSALAFKQPHSDRESFGILTFFLNKNVDDTEREEQARPLLNDGTQLDQCFSYIRNTENAGKHEEKKEPSPIDPRQTNISKYTLFLPQHPDNYSQLKCPTPHFSHTQKRDATSHHRKG